MYFDTLFLNFFYLLFLHYNMQLSKFDDKHFENPQTKNLKKIMEDCVLVRSCLQDLNNPLPDDKDAQLERRKKVFVC